jgi:hypothetical protein
VFTTHSHRNLLPGARDRPARGYPRWSAPSSSNPACLGPRPARQVTAASQVKVPVAAAHLGDAREDNLAFTACRESAQGVMGRNDTSGTRLTVEIIQAQMENRSSKGVSGSGQRRGA